MSPSSDDTRAGLRDGVWRALVLLGRDYPPGHLRASLMVFAPHPDDETLGCGGLMLRKRQAGAAVRVVFLTDGTQSHAAWIPKDRLKDQREREAVTACGRLGVAPDAVEFCRFPDDGLAESRDIAIARVERLLRAARPEEVAVPYRHDVTRDHVDTWDIVRAAVRSAGLRVRVLEYPIWFWNAWPWTALPPGGRAAVEHLLRSALGLARLLVHLRCQVAIGTVLPGKRAALDGHRSQMVRDPAHPAWPVLADVAGGAFLPCFFRSHERFMMYRYGDARRSGHEGSG